MRNEKGEFIVPEFKSDIPANLLRGKTESERWIYEQLSIQGQQNAWLIRRSCKADERQMETDRDLEELNGKVLSLDELKKALSAKWSVVAVVCSLVGVPLLMVFLGEWIKKTFFKP